ncbi:MULTISPECIES: hypothetical protein [unclassified Aureispira]|uniref:hypothetical protein n=1 Tax=unclassified Aureispira TaxID=2649989 RepID=UPI0012DD91B6|nr:MULTISPECIES: hypothetical protein [unclassified Aureispira]WMX16402.1 hypothetical protein QP953_08485 [Aureispira sp. CCB-E]
MHLSDNQTNTIFQRSNDELSTTKIQNPLHLLKNKAGVMDFIVLLRHFNTLSKWT